MDKRNGRFDDTLAALREHYGAGVFPLNLPINPGAGFNQALDVRRNEVVAYDTSDSRGIAAKPWNISHSAVAELREWRDRAK